jgi:hypothetical protein
MSHHVTIETCVPPPGSSTARKPVAREAYDRRFSEMNPSALLFLVLAIASEVAGHREGSYFLA